LRLFLDRTLMNSRLTVLLLLLSAFGCAHSKSETKEAEATDTSEDVVAIRRRATVDLNCNSEIKVDVVEEGSMWRPWTFAASGCGQRATYLSRMGTIIRN
jgi:hypothetical protein